MSDWLPVVFENVILANAVGAKDERTSGTIFACEKAWVTFVKDEVWARTMGKRVNVRMSM